MVAIWSEPSWRRVDNLFIALKPKRKKIPTGAIRIAASALNEMDLGDFAPAAVAKWVQLN